MKTLIVGISYDLYSLEKFCNSSPITLYEEAQRLISESDGNADIWTLPDFLWMCNCNDVLPTYYFTQVMVADDEADKWIK